MSATPASAPASPAHPQGLPAFAARQWETVLAVVAVALLLGLVWGFDFFPSVDGPAHLHLAYGLYEALRGDAFYGQFFELNRTFNPNLLTQAMLVALTAVVSPFVAEKIFLTVYFVGFALAAGYALKSMNRTALCLLPLLLFCSVSFPLAFGFYNFSFGAVVFLIWYGFWWRHRATWSGGVVLGHAVLGVLAYLTHIFAFLVCGFAIASTALGIVVLHLAERRQSGAPPDWRMLRALLLPPLIGGLPEIVAAAVFVFLRFGEHTADAAANFWSLKLPHLYGFFFGTSFAPYDAAESVPAAAFVLTLLVLLAVLLRQGDRKASLPLAVCFAAFFLLYLVMPYQWIVRWMPARFQPFVFMALLVWLAALIPALWPLRARRLVAAAGMVLLAASATVRYDVFGEIDGYYREYASAVPHIAPGSTLVGLRLHSRLDGRPFPAKMAVLFQAGSHIATASHSVDLKNFQGQSPDHPIQFRAGMEGTAPLGGNDALTAMPPYVDVMGYERQTGRPIDYFLLWGRRSAITDAPDTAALFDQLDRDYILIYTSTPNGFLNLYRRKPAPVRLSGTSPSVAQ